MVHDVAIRLTENWRATFIPIGVVLASIVAFLGVFLARRHERSLKFEEIHWHKRAELYTAFRAAHEHTFQSLGDFSEGGFDQARRALSLQVIAMSFYAPLEVTKAANAAASALDEMQRELKQEAERQGVRNKGRVFPSETFGDAYSETLSTFVIAARIDLQR